MSEPLQFDNHPDADQICAFVEAALPAHEREQILDHLAECTECRAVVALSLPQAEEPEHAPAAARFRPWWSGWRMAWPVGVATAALVLAVFYVHQGAVVQQTRALPQIAEGRMAAPPAPERQSSAAVANRPLRSTPNQPAVASRPAEVAGLGVGSPRKAEQLTSSGHESAPGIMSRNSIVLDKLAQPAPAPSTANPGQALGFSAGSGGRIGAAPTASAGALLQNAPPAQEAKKSDTAEAPSIASDATTLSGRNTQTITVNNSAVSVETETVDMSSFALSENEAQLAQFIQLKHPLPSGLAIDSQDGIFLSEDAGRHWKAIRVQWQGRAVRVERVGLAPVDSAYLKLGRAPELATLNAVGAAPVSNAAPAGIAAGRPLVSTVATSLAGTVTDVTGAVIPGAAVSLIENATHTVHAVIADRAGHYLVDGLTPGSYTLEAKARGFANQSVADVAVAVNRQNVANISLKIGAATQTVTVSAGSVESVTDTAVAGSSAKSKKREPLAASQAAPVFALTTDNGERWTSTDGVTWKRP